MNTAAEAEKLRESRRGNRINMKEEKLAVLIDADNISSKYVKDMLEEIAKNGTLTVKRIYGDWTTQGLTSWKSVLLENAITPVQQYGYTSGKNSSDSALIIDAMDILYTGRVDGFCIVSSDSDFTRLAIRLREAGMKVIGFGEKKTPVPFIKACNKFLYVEVLKGGPTHITAIGPTPEKKAGKVPLTKVDQAVEDLIIESVSDIADDGGWAFLGVLGNHILKRMPDFDPRNFGYTKMLPLIKSLGRFEIDERDSGINTAKLIYVRLK